MLPGEEEIAREIRNRLGSALTAGEYILQHCLGILEADPLRPPEFVFENRLSLHLSRGTLVKACKLFRSALAEAKLGADDALQLISRTLFESATTMSFLTTESLELHGEVLAPEERARIYSAYQTVKFADKILKGGPVPRDVDAKQLAANLNFAEQSVGSRWINLFRKHPWTYSGLNLRELTEKLCPSLKSWHRQVYPDMSNKLHASDAGHHVAVENMETFPRWHSSLLDIANNYRGCAAFLVHVTICYISRFEVDGIDREVLHRPLTDLSDSVEQLFLNEESEAKKESNSCD